LQPLPIPPSCLSECGGPRQRGGQKRSRGTARLAAAFALALVAAAGLLWRAMALPHRLPTDPAGAGPLGCDEAAMKRLYSVAMSEMLLACCPVGARGQRPDALHGAVGPPYSLRFCLQGWRSSAQAWRSR
jgi:hypothetical protein